MKPVVSAAEAIFGGVRPREFITYVIAQVAGAVVGVVVASLMFSLPAITLSSHVRSSPALWLGEVVATFELVLGPIADVVIDRFSRKAVLIDAHLCFARHSPCRCSGRRAPGTRTWWQLAWRAVSSDTRIPIQRRKNSRLSDVWI